MIKVLIIDVSEQNTVSIANKISELYSDTNIILTTELKKVDGSIQKIKPDIVVVKIDDTAQKRKQLLEKLMRWDFKIMEMVGEDLYEIIR